MPVTLKLRKPITSHDGRLGEITVREPTYEDLRAVGQEPSTTVVAGNGQSFFVQVDVETVGRYADRLVGPAAAVSVLHLLSIQDALALQRVIVGFFRVGDEEEPSPETSPSPTSSSSA